ncbi:MAG: 2-C-methyl-D-erythritol 4-phosphate cytidylyltransferase [Candidatus Omnitrophica bacterium]|nr:2-C-methyl-D-erythritol 4-phosphate cytidylyltransferase [Candidatus Omnitrophota bacterium]
MTKCNTKIKNTALILAGGIGARMKTATPKQFLNIAGKPVVVHTMLAFEKSKYITDIILICPKEYIDKLKDLTKKYGFKKVKAIVAGGKTRQKSSYNGLKKCSKGTQCVLIHDAVRPFVTDKIIKDTLEAAERSGASDTVIDTADTIVEERNGFIKKIPLRKYLKRGQTPQGFNYKAIMDAHKKAIKNPLVKVTDDCGLVTAFGGKVELVEGSVYNIKLTEQTDLYLAERLFQMQSDDRIESVDYRDLYGKTAVVFGGSGGIGAEVVTLLKKYGCNAVPLNLSSDIKCDITKETSVKKALNKVVKKYGRIDIVVNSAGLLNMSTIEKMELKTWEKVINVNLTGAFILSKHCIPILKKRKEAHIVHVASSSYTLGRENYSAYSASKAGLVNFCQALAEEVIKDNIYVNVISPQRVNTPMRNKNFGAESGETLLSPYEVAEKIVKYCVLKETGHVVDVRNQR